MTHTPHDQLAKQLLEYFLSRFGSVQPNLTIPAEVRWTDLYFDPYPELTADPNSIGVMGQLVGQRCLIEPFHNPATTSDVRNCLEKLFTKHAEIEREARRDQRSLKPHELPLLWILVPTASPSFIQTWGLKRVEGSYEGLYQSIDGLFTRVIALHQLPEIKETLWLRLLGKASKQLRAIQEVIELSEEDPDREEVMRLLVSWKVTMDSRGVGIQAELPEELNMVLSQIYQEWEAKTKQQALQQGLQQGEEQGITKVALNMLRKGVPQEQIAEFTGLTLEQIQKLL